MILYQSSWRLMGIDGFKIIAVFFSYGLLEIPWVRWFSHWNVGFDQSVVRCQGHGYGFLALEWLGRTQSVDAVDVDKFRRRAEKGIELSSKKVFSVIILEKKRSSSQTFLFFENMILRNWKIWRLNVWKHIVPMSPIEKNFVSIAFASPLIMESSRAQQWPA